MNLPKFPKLGFTYLISDESWFPFKDMVQTFRVRLAYGPSSREPGPTARLRLYNTPTQVFVDSQFQTGIQLSHLGNTEVRPERVTELEGGFDADLLDSRLNLSVTGYRKTTTDALMALPVAPEIYGHGVRITKNIGVLRNTGLEITAGAQLVRSGPITWSTHINFSQNRNVMVALGTGIDPFYTEGGPAGGIRVAPGYPVFGRWARPILGYADANANDALEPDEVQLGDTAVYLGTTIPDYTASLSTTLSLWHGAVTVNADFSRTDGIAQANGPAQGIARFSPGRQVPGTPLDEQVRTIELFKNIPLDQRTSYNQIQTPATTRFNSFAVTYAVPTALAQRLGAQVLRVSLRGGNLKVWTSYSGVDPNVNAYGTGNSVADTGVMPMPRTWQFQVSATY